MLIIDSKLREFEKEKLKELGFDLFEIPQNPDLYYEISSHPDIHFCKIQNTLFSSKNINLNNSIKGNTFPNGKYPKDIPYNLCNIGNYVVHNFKYTDSKLLDYIEKNNLEKIQINQGYSKCSIAVIDEKSAIVTNEKIAKELEKYNIKVLLLPYSVQKNIKLYKNENKEYSEMFGFIGGIISRIDDYIFVSGDLKNIDKDNKIQDFILERNLKIIDFPNKDLIDYGGIIQV